MPDTIANVVRRFLPVAIFFAFAFAIDMLTGQRYSSVWGSVAIVASLVHLFPAIRPMLVALGGYIAIWVSFNLVRAVADDIGFAIAGRGTIGGWERALFGDSLPSTQLQASFFHNSAVRVHDIVLSFIYGSFFVVPFVVGIFVWWRARALFRPYAVATAITFTLGLVGFLLLPTAPPWMSDPQDVTRIARHVLGATMGMSPGSGQDTVMGEALRFEPNHLAAMPSIHVSVVVLVFLLSRRIGRIPGVIGAVYALLMTVGVVYLGEHFVLDAIFGWVIAIASWRLACEWFAEGVSGHPKMCGRRHSSACNGGNQYAK